MNDKTICPTRRQVLQGLAASTAASSLRVFADTAAQTGMETGMETEPNIIRKVIPSSGEQLPVIGMGTWITFNVGNNEQAIENCRNVLTTFFAMGGTVIDSSPMYGSAEATLGKVFDRLGTVNDKSVFSASKIWTSAAKEGPIQFFDSIKLWNLPTFDLFQVHNLRNWQAHIKTLQQLKEQRLTRYIGITTSHGRRHDDFINVMREVKPDFIQVTYNVVDREVEDYILPLAADLGIAVFINRPFQGGNLFRSLGGKPLPTWARDIDCENWAQLMLKFVVSHPAVTCAIPATSQVAHMKENMGAQVGALPDKTHREKIAALFS